jgi:hypothetical protein
MQKQSRIGYIMPDFDTVNVEDNEGTPFETPLQDDQPNAEDHEDGREESKPKARPSRKIIKKTADVTPAVVNAVLQWADRVRSADQKTIDLASDLLNVRNPDESKLISALMDASSVSDARKKISSALDLANLDDLRFAVEVARLDHSDRKDLWDLESKIDPDLASSITDGSGKLPPNDLYAEVSLLRRLQKESSLFRSSLDSVTELLG